ncbi:2OG-Fe(II) oxygenase [Sphingobium phenoxybenzoativorans]|uniref:2OG-Fe(II) oxygenase n=1 Tax=Sphingobium phenoxybenzoativorans TaxID=1592790 RepID=A0A975K812_9SPHN|nr:2OG-Fe(II) oxygenase [Sphingobium phenoxybenzoativorans]QUT06501.1 2OG-Fe(II) oxygenase [Sphingobium phenoxybenzoativorans]
MLGPGDPIPSLYLRTDANPRYALDSVAGRHVVMMFVGGLRVPGVVDMLRQLYASADPFDDLNACCFVITCDPADQAEPSLCDRYPGIRVVRDHDRELARLFGCAQDAGNGVDRLSLMTWILDPGLRVLDVIPVDDASTHLAQITERLSGLASPAADMDGCAPVLRVPNLFEPELCRRLIAYARETGTQDSGYMKTDPATGETMMVVDHGHKRRSDCNIEDAGLRDAIQARVIRRLAPQIERAFQFKVTRMERYIVACYDAQTGGYFRPHKDNTTLGTAHRRFAVTINLNAEDYEGGDLRFPEFGMRTYRAPTGGAIVFSCSLLHEATPIVSGQRYCVLPFLYDEAGAAIRLANAQHLQDPILREQVVASVTDTPARAA